MQNNESIYKCKICGRKLTSLKSIRRGVGATCEMKKIEELNKGQLRWEDLECSNLKYQEK